MLNPDAKTIITITLPYAEKRCPRFSAEDPYIFQLRDYGENNTLLLSANGLKNGFFNPNEITCSNSAAYEIKQDDDEEKSILSSPSSLSSLSSSTMSSPSSSSSASESSSSPNVTTTDTQDSGLIDDNSAEKLTYSIFHFSFL
eukprot:Awhi_evm1s3391